MKKIKFYNRWNHKFKKHSSENVFIIDNIENNVINYFLLMILKFVLFMKLRNIWKKKLNFILKRKIY